MRIQMIKKFILQSRKWRIQNKIYTIYCAKTNQQNERPYVCHASTIAFGFTKKGKRVRRLNHLSPKVSRNAFNIFHPNFLHIVKQPIQNVLVMDCKARHNLLLV